MTDQPRLYDAAIVASGGDFDPTGYHVAAIGAKDANELVIAHHYLHRRPNTRHAFGLIADTGRIDGVVIFGTPASREAQISIVPSDPSLVLELNRLWVRDELGRNAESFLVSRALKMLPPTVVISYADTAYGHVGIIYRALGFNYAGWTDMDRRTPRFDYAVPGRHSRDAYRGGDSAPRWTHKVRRTPKARYWTITGNRKQRHELRKLVRWHSISWKDYPVPSNHKFQPLDDLRQSP
jgi:hypothetical protein